MWRVEEIWAVSLGQFIEFPTHLISITSEEGGD